MKEAREAAAIDPVRQYLSEIGRHPLLSPEEELDVAYSIRDGAQAQTELVEMKKLADELGFEVEQERLEPLELVIQAGEAAREHMIKSNLRLVVSVAKRYTGTGMPLLDLIQEGNIGLFKAVDKFDPDRGFKFSTYATWWIRQGISRAVGDQSRMIRIPVHMHDQLYSLRRAETQLLEKNSDITPESLAEYMNLSIEQVHTIIEARNKTRMVELDRPIGDEEEATLGDMIGKDDETFEKIDEAMRTQGLGHLALSVLSERELSVILNRYYEVKTLETIGQEMGITRERVRQIESKAIHKLRHRTLREPDLLRDDHLESILEKNSGEKANIHRRYDVDPVVLDAIRGQLEKRQANS